MSEQISISELVRNIGEYNIAIHGIHSGTLQEKVDTANSIFNSGLNMSNNWKTILGTAVSIGGRGNIGLERDIRSYRYGNGERCNVIIRVPNMISSSSGKKIYLGFPEPNKRTAAQQYLSTCVFDQICGALHRIPKEFVYGYYTDSGIIERNPGYYDNLEQDKKDDLFATMQSSMNDFSKYISECVINRDIEKLKVMKRTFDERGLEDLTLNGAIKEALFGDQLRKFATMPRNPGRMANTQPNQGEQGESRTPERMPYTQLNKGKQRKSRNQDDFER